MKKMKNLKIGYLGAGSWGFCLARLLALKGYEVVSWTKNSDLANLLNKKENHPLFYWVLLTRKYPFHD